MLLAGAICGFGYAVFSGQPLTIIGATGPLLVFESIVFQICKLVMRYMYCSIRSHKVKIILIIMRRDTLSCCVFLSVLFDE